MTAELLVFPDNRWRGFPDIQHRVAFTVTGRNEDPVISNGQRIGRIYVIGCYPFVRLQLLAGLEIGNMQSSCTEEQDGL